MSRVYIMFIATVMIACFDKHNFDVQSLCNKHAAVHKYTHTHTDHFDGILSVKFCHHQSLFLLFVLIQWNVGLMWPEKIFSWEQNILSQKLPDVLTFFSESKSILSLFFLFFQHKSSIWARQISENWTESRENFTAPTHTRKKIPYIEPTLFVKNVDVLELLSFAARSFFHFVFIVRLFDCFLACRFGQMRWRQQLFTK